MADLKMNSLYLGLQRCVWVIKISSNKPSGTPLSVTFATGFCVDSKGLILTCSHIFIKRYTRIQLRRLSDADFIFEAELVYRRTKWDLALLQLKGIDDCFVGKLGGDEIFAGQTLLHIGHPLNFVGSFSIGESAFQCHKVVASDGHQRCGDYTCTALQHTPNFRVMGDVWNSNYFDNTPGSFAYEKNLDPLTPIIQINGLVANDGCSGGPVFNTDGDIVGVLVLGTDGFVIAIHVAMVKHFLKEMAGNLKRDVIRDDEVGSSKRPKGHGQGR